jgi:WD40 repeat protein/serine/threonine protein kinase
MPTRTPDNAVRRWCEALDRRLRAGEDGRAEEYLAREPSLDPEDAVELVYTEFVGREERGEPVDPAAFLARFPALRGALEEQFLVHAVMHGEAARRTPQTGQRVGPYRLERELGRGGRGAVFAAADTRDGKRVALKLLLSGEYSTPDDLALFQHEAAVLGRLDHPNLIRILDAGVADGRPYLAVEFVDGPTLAARVADYRSPPAAAELVETLARAVHHAHAQGVVHRDLKPSNVLLAGAVPKVSDFGLARVLDAEGGRTRTGDILGTLGYMAPEQAAGTAHRAGPPADVYALGAILFELLTGRTPFGPDASAQTLYRLLHDPAPSVSRYAHGTPRDLDTVCLKCLEKHPDSRYPSALALADDLRRFLNGKPVDARPPGTAKQVARWAVRRPSAAALVGVLVVTLVGVTVGAVYHTASLEAELGRSEKLNTDLQGALDTAETLRGETRRQNEQLAKQLDDAKRAMYALQLSQMPALWRKEPVRARGLLADERACPPGLRDFTWRYFQQACGLDERDFEAHKGTVTAVAFLPDGRLVTAGDDGKIRVWNGSKAVATGNHGAAVTGLVGLDGDTLVTVGRNRQVKQWRTRDLSKPVLTARIASTPLGLTASSEMQSWATLALPCADGLLRFFTADTLQPAGELPAHCGLATVAAYSRDGHLIASAGEDGRVAVWRALDKKPLHTWDAHPDAVQALAFSHDGKTLVSGSDTGDVTVWNPATGEKVRSLSGHLFAVHAIAYAPDGERMLTGGFDSYLKLWDASTGTELTNVMRRWVTAAAFSPEGNRVAIGSPQGRVTVFRVPALAPPVAYPQKANVVSLAVRPGGSVTGDTAGVVRVWDTGKPEPSATWQATTAEVRGLAVSPDGGTVAVGAGNEVVLYDPAGRLLHRLPGHTGPVTALSFDPTGKFLASGSADKSVRVWDAKTREAVAALTGHAETIEALTFDPAGTRLVSASDDFTLRIWAVDGWKPTVLKGHGQWVLSAAFDPTGRFLASGSRDRTVRVWDTTGPNPPLVLTGYTNWVHSVEFAPDGKTLVAGSGHYSLDSPGEVKFLDPVAGYVRAILSDVRAPARFASPDRLLVGVAGGMAELVAGPK